jgi:hypothetical protein
MLSLVPRAVQSSHPWEAYEAAVLHHLCRIAAIGWPLAAYGHQASKIYRAHAPHRILFDHVVHA